MTTKDEALKLALEALESSRVFVTTREKIKHPEGTEWYDECIAALRERLAQPEQEPVAWMCSDESLVHKGYARFSRFPGGDWNIPVYIAPPRREWVGLTDEEYSQLHDGLYQQGKSLGWIVDQVEIKLREKNA